MSETAQRRVTVGTLIDMKASGEKVVVLTVYDAGFTHVLEEAGVDVLLVGDSLGMVLQGRDSTLGVTLDDMVYHGACVARAGNRALRVIDMPFMSYRSLDQALYSAGRLMAEGGAHMVKLEGGRILLDTVRALTERGIPVCGHLGLLPQSVNQLGGYRVQARDERHAVRLLEDARALEDAGASMLVLECIPARLAAEVSQALRIPTIGIGAGAGCDGQVLVLYDLLGITPSGRRPRFATDFLAGSAGVAEAVAKYAEAVRSGAFPAPEQAF
jgi:3-methyl-2-oxobutanoate hydroxymethyltransferase